MQSFHFVIMTAYTNTMGQMQLMIVAVQISIIYDYIS